MTHEIDREIAHDTMPTEPRVGVEFTGTYADVLLELEQATGVDKDTLALEGLRLRITAYNEAARGNKLQIRNAFGSLIRDIPLDSKGSLLQ